jgi:hypothetical protein
MATYEQGGPEGREQWLRITTTPDQADQFFALIVNDPEFRARLEQDPRQVLMEYGIEVSPGSIPAHVRLPSPEHIEQVLGEAREKSLLGEYGTASFLMLLFVYPAFALAVGDEIDGAN